MSWTPTRLRYVADLNPPIRPELLQEPSHEVSFLPMEAVGEDGSLDLERTRPVADVRNGYSYFEDGDVAIAKVTPCFENGKGALMRGLVGGAGFGTTELTVLRPRPGVDARFLRYFLASAQFMADAAGAMTGAGGLKRVPDWFVRDYPARWPQHSIQERIANFLDEQTARIDALIAEEQQLLTRLGEYLDASIAQRILGEDVPGPRTKTNVAEAPELPQGWKLAPMMRLTDPARPIMYGIVLPGPNVEEGPSVPIVKGGDVRPHRLKRELLNRTTPEIEAPFARARLTAGDIVYSIRGTIGDAELVPAELAGANITQDVARIAPLAGLDKRWLLFAAKSRPVFCQLEELSLGAAVRGINIFDLKRARVPTPPRPVQQRIAEELTAMSTRIAALREHCNGHIAKLVEYRSSLISAAVTGQLDVSMFTKLAPVDHATEVLA